MGGKSAPAPAPVQQQAPPEPVKPTPIPDANANPDQTRYGAYTSYATQEAAEAQKNEEKKGLGATGVPTERRRKPQRDPAALVNEGGALGTSAVLTG